MKKLILETYVGSLPESTFTDYLKAYLAKENIATKGDEYRINLFNFIDSLPETFALKDFLSHEDNEIYAHVLKIWSLRSYNNETTFLSRESILYVAPDDRIVLDGYLFDQHELVAVIESGRPVGTNPYIEFENSGKPDDLKIPALFSDAALRQMRSHPDISDVIAKKEVEQRLAQASITPEILTQVVTMLTAINVAMSSGGTESEKLSNANAAIMRFAEYQLTLPESVQASLNHYLIKCQLRGGGEQNMKFKDALSGGGSATGCILTTQIFLWQFVK